MGLISKPYTLADVDPHQIDRGERFREDFGDMGELIESVKENGVISPVLLIDKSKLTEEQRVLLDEKDPDLPYLLVAGERRTEASQEAELEVIPAKIFSEPLDEYELRLLELEENDKRADIGWAAKLALREKVHSLRVALYGPKTQRVSGPPEEVGVSLADTARELGVSRATMTRDVNFAKVVKEMPELAQADSQKSAEKQFDAIVKREAIQILTARMAKRNADEKFASEKSVIKKLYKTGNSQVEIRKVEDESVSFIDLDPPFGIELDDVKRSDVQDYNEIDPALYEDFMRPMLNECYRIMRPNSTMIVWFGPEPWFEPMAQWIEEAGKPEGMSVDDWLKSGQGFKIRRLPCAWIRNSGQSRAPEIHPASCMEFFFHVRKGNPKLAKPGARNFFQFSPVAAAKKRHPTEKPVELYQSILNTFAHPRSRCISPFLGSGNVILAAQNLNLPIFGWDIEPQNKASFDLAVENGEPGKYASYG